MGGFACGAPQHHGSVADTAEVALAKARFFQAYNARLAASPQQATFVHQQPRWTGAMAHGVPAGVTGLNQVPETAAVKAAKASFLAAFKAQLAATGNVSPVVAVRQSWAPAAPVQTWAPAAAVQSWAPAVPVQARWTGPMAATVPADVHGAPMQVGQTADVAAATQAHFAAHQHALRATG